MLMHISRMRSWHFFFFRNKTTYFRYMRLLCLTSNLRIRVYKSVKAQADTHRISGLSLAFCSHECYLSYPTELHSVNPAREKTFFMEFRWVSVVFSVQQSLLTSQPLPRVTTVHYLRLCRPLICNNTRLNYIVLICAQRMLYDSMVSKGDTGHIGIEKTMGPMLHRATILERAHNYH